MRARDEREFREYVQERLTGWRRSAYLLCGDPHTADDVVSAMLAKLLRHWRRVGGLAGRDAYVRRMLVTTFLDERRRPWRHEHPTEAVPEPEPLPEIDVTDRLELMAALDRLPPRCRAVLVLRFFEDLSVEQTAEVLGCAPGTVKAHTHQGLATLRTALRPDPDDVFDTRAHQPAR
jgi:RNA polymerase sigma-70 factor (sigma-E family)